MNFHPYISNQQKSIILLSMGHFMIIFLSLNKCLLINYIVKNSTNIKHSKRQYNTYVNEGHKMYMRII